MRLVLKESQNFTRLYHQELKAFYQSLERYMNFLGLTPLTPQPYPETSSWLMSYPDHSLTVDITFFYDSEGTGKWEYEIDILAGEVSPSSRSQIADQQPVYPPEGEMWNSSLYNSYGHPVSSQPHRSEFEAIEEAIDRAEAKYLTAD